MIFLFLTAFIEQTSDRFYPFADSVPKEYDGLEQSLPGRSAHYGPLLTVGGTLLQNRQMLHFYNHIWGCIGLEMGRYILLQADFGISAT